MVNILSSADSRVQEEDGTELKGQTILCVAASENLTYGYVLGKRSRILPLTVTQHVRGIGRQDAALRPGAVSYYILREPASLNVSQPGTLKRHMTRGSEVRDLRRLEQDIDLARIGVCSLPAAPRGLGVQVLYQKYDLCGNEIQGGT